MPETIPVLWLCGPPGVGKTAVGWELYTRLARAGRAPAYLDIDQVGMCYPAPAGDLARHELKARNVAALRVSFGAAGARGLIVSGVVDARRGPVITLAGGGDITVCRLRAGPGEIVTRLGERQGSAVGADAALREGELLDRSTFAGWCVDTTGLPVDEVADQVGAKIGEWPSAGETGGRPPGGDVREPGPDRGGQVLWLCGPTGVGKSTVGFQAYLAVLRSGVPAGYVDVDQLGFCATKQKKQKPIDHVLRARYLAALWANFRAAGARALVAVGPITTGSDAFVYEQALPAASFTWCRLHAGPAELTRRILSRGDGGSWSQPGDPLKGQPTSHLLAVADRAVADAQVLEREGHGLRIDVDGSTVEEAAETILTRTRPPIA